MFPNPEPLVNEEMIRRHTNNTRIVTATTLLVSNLDYTTQITKEETNLKTPFLQPRCHGREKNLMECDQFGLSVLLDPACYDGTRRLYISVVQLKVPQTRPPNFVYFLNNDKTNFSLAAMDCENMSLPSFGLGVKESSTIVDLRRSENEEEKQIKEQLEMLGIIRLWTSPDQFVIVDDRHVVNGILVNKKSVVCKVNGNFYPLRCGPLGIPECEVCEEVAYVRNEYWEVVCACEPKICPMPKNCHPCVQKRSVEDACGCETNICDFYKSCDEYLYVPCGPCEQLTLEEFGKPDCPCVRGVCKPLRYCDNFDG